MANDFHSCTCLSNVFSNQMEKRSINSTILMELKGGEEEEKEGTQHTFMLRKCAVKSKHIQKWYFWLCMVAGLLAWCLLWLLFDGNSFAIFHKSYESRLTWKLHIKMFRNSLNTDNKTPSIYNFRHINSTIDRSTDCTTNTDRAWAVACCYFATTWYWLCTDHCLPVLSVNKPINSFL